MQKKIDISFTQLALFRDKVRVLDLEALKQMRMDHARCQCRERVYKYFMGRKKKNK